MCRVQKAKKSTFLPEKQQNDRQTESRERFGWLFFIKKACKKKR